MPQAKISTLLVIGVAIGMSFLVGQWKQHYNQERFVVSCSKSIGYRDGKEYKELLLERDMRTNKLTYACS